MALEQIPGYTGFRGGPAGPAYNEAAFQHFLAVDRRRAERTMRSLLLVLVTMREAQGKSNLSPATAAALFAGLGECVREVDFVGWYREGRVAAAVLAQGIHSPVEARLRTTDRIAQALAKRLTVAQARDLRVRVVRLTGRVRQ